MECAKPGTVGVRAGSLCVCLLGIGLLELIGQEWGRGQIHGRIGKFPLNFTEVVEPLPTSVTELGETDKPALTDTAMTENSGELKAALSSSLHLYASLLWTTANKSFWGFFVL